MNINYIQKKTNNIIYYTNIFENYCITQYIVIRYGKKNGIYMMTYV